MHPHTSRARSLVLAGLFFLGGLSLPAQALNTTGAGQTQVSLAPPVFTAAPTVSDGPNPDVPLAGVVKVQTDVPTRVRLLIWDGLRVSKIDQPSPGYTTDHEMPLLGLRAGTMHFMLVSVISKAGVWSYWPKLLPARTPQLPADFPPIDVEVLDTARGEPGYLMLAPSSVTVGNPAGPRASYGMILDQGGNVVWYIDRAALTQRLRNGNLLAGRDGVQEIDMLGNVINNWYPAGLDDGAGALPGAILMGADTIHHEFVEMPESADSDFLFLSTEMRTYPNYPLNELNPNVTVPSADVVGDVIVEIDRSGRIVREKRLLDILDPYRIAYDNSLGFYNGRYGGPTRDWSHGNSVYFDETDDTYIMSLRHQDCVVKIRRSTTMDSPDDVVWILGNHNGWGPQWASKLLTPIGMQVESASPIGPNQEPSLFEWNYHQHAAFPTPDGTLMLFDNGNYRSSPGQMWLPQPTWYSRAVEYDIDPVTRTVRQVWAAGGRADSDVRRIGFAAFVSNAEHQPLTGNVLINAGATIDPATGVNFVRIFEFDKEDLDNPVLRISIKDDTGTLAYSNYRTRRLTSVYPPR